ncbi:MAG: Ig-like domain-containing protein, partial [Oscillospiraceae bacterium]|nr:Ig-like domain-containing protein [Oscillospiraceae bacterium]
TNATIHYNSAPAGSSDELKLNRETLTISNNVCPVITVTEYPEGVEAEDLVWSSSNSEVASINSENVVTPNHYGKTEIKVETKDGKYSATCELTVEASFVITSDSSSVKSIRRGDTAEYRIYFYNCEAEELPVDEVELSIIDGGALQLISYGIIDNYLYVNIKGVSEGAGVIEVYSDNPLAYNKFKISVYPENIDWRADKVPNYTKKNTENFRRSSFIVENYNYIYDENTETYTVSMDVYNMAGDYPVLAAYNSSGKMVDFDVAERFVEMPGDWESFFGTLGFGAVQMVTGDLFTYRAVTNSKKTTVSVKVPADGYITISNDITASPAAAIVNLGGLMIEIASLTCNLSEEDSEKNKDVTKEFVKSLKEKLPDSDEFLYDLIEKFTEKVAKKTTRDYVIGITQFSQDALYELCNEAGSSFAELAGDAFKSVLKKDVKALITKSAMEKLIKEDMVDATVLSKLKVAEMLFKAGNLLGLVDYALNALKFNNGSGITTIQFNPCGENGFVCKDTIKIVSNVIDEDTVLQHFIIKDAGKLAITKQELQIDPKDIVELHEIALIKNGNKVEGVEFKATVEMDIPKTMFAPTVKVFRIEKDGSYTKLETKVKDGKITFTTDHFSEYVLSGRSIDEAVSGVSLNAEAVDIVNKQTYQLVATVSPETAPNKSLVWSSGDEKVATVDENGLVSAVSPGTAVITATTVDGGFTASCGITVLPRTFSVTWVVEGVETTSEFNEGEKIIKPDSPIKKGYTFAGWSPEIPETMPSEDITFFAVFECVSGISIKNNTGTKTISYGETLRMTAVATDIPENAKIEWYVDGVKKGEGETFEVSPKNGSIEITVKIVDSNGNVLKDKNGNEILDSEKVSVNSGLWQKIVSFFKNLFGINRTVVQAIFKGII